MLAAVVQMSSQNDLAKNLSTASRLVNEAANAGAKVVALPENFAFMGAEEADKLAIAEELSGTGPIMSALREMAKKHSIHLIAGGMPEKSGDPRRPFNTSVSILPNGDVGPAYRKVHLFDVDLADGTSLKESNATSAGSDVVALDVNGITLGMSVCYDIRFPELYRKLGALGSRIVTVPAAFTMMTGKDHWHVLMRARAIENQVFVLAPAQWGKHPRGRQTYGKSLICDPWGDILAQAPEGEGIAVARLDFAAQDRVRAQLPCLTHKRL